MTTALDPLETASARERLRWAVDEFDESLLFTSSFGAGSAVLLHLWSEVARGLPVVFLDTGFHFDETLVYRDELVSRLGLTLKIVRSATPTRRFLEIYGSDIQKRNSDLCCAENKVAPLQPELVGKRAWVSGLRRDQGRSRETVKILQPTEGGIAKVHPIADWSARDVYLYMRSHNLPEHPLFDQGYVSIGCAPCTRPITDGESERDGRWSGTAKTECGLHTFLKPAS